MKQETKKRPYLAPMAEIYGFAAGDILTVSDPDDVSMDDFPDFNDPFN